LTASARAFIQECAEHFDQGRGIAAIVEDPDNYFWHLMEMSVLARREGRPSPHAWFEAFCARLMDEDDGRREPQAEPAVN
jgi:hypothetical protein